MGTVGIAAIRGTNAVRKLREQKLRQGLPFMINTKELASTQCYLEYPDGSITLATIANSTSDLNVVRILSRAEANRLRASLRIAY